MANQRKIKCNESLNPLVEMMKHDVEEQRLGKYVVIPDSTDVAFNVWWRNLSSLVVVPVRYPHARHGNSGKTSNSAKTTVREDFLHFVDMNSQPNGRSTDSSSPTHYFIPKFTNPVFPILKNKRGSQSLESSIMFSGSLAKANVQMDLLPTG